ncbi:hypothetical protein ACYOEI_25485 [Singulisphaera rosea]
MARPELIPLDRPEVAPRAISPRLRSQLVYFMSSEGAPGVPPLGENEFWFATNEVDKWVEDGVIYLVSPLDTANMTEVELSEEQESFLGWLKDKGVQHVRLAE